MGRGLGPQVSVVPLQTHWDREARRRFCPSTTCWMSFQSLALRGSKLSAGALGRRGWGAGSRWASALLDMIGAMYAEDPPAPQKQQEG
eukprot:8107260-Pyramimonas_sp.AAC.1